MNEIREIVTKAIVEKGKKQIRFTDTIKTINQVESVLGCWVLNHSFSAEKVHGGVEVNGKFEVNIWYSHSNNTKTDVVKQVVNYSQVVKTKRKINDYLEQDNDVIVRMIQTPMCSDVKIVDNNVEIEVILEVVAEVIGETKIKVTVLDQLPNFDQDDNDDLDDEIEANVNTKFIREKLF
jgi:spore coat protein E